MKKSRIARGEKGYLAQQRTKEWIMTIGIFAISAILFITGYLETKTNMNLLSMVGVLGVFPGVRCLMTLVFYLKCHGISEDDYEKIHSLTESLTGSFDNIITTRDEVYDIPSIVIRSQNVCGYTSKKYDSVHALEKHMEECFKKGGHAVNVKIFDNLNAYKTRLESLNKLEETKQEKDLEIKKILFEISL